MGLELKESAWLHNIKRGFLLIVGGAPFVASEECNRKIWPVLHDMHSWSMDVLNQVQPHPCLFANILDVTLADRKQLTGTAHGFASKKRKVFDSGVTASVRCYAHQGSQSGFPACHLPTQVDYGCSGLPCQDMSKAGLGRKSEGPTAPVYMTHALYCRQNKIPLLTVECTPDACLMNVRSLNSLKIFGLLGGHASNQLGGVVRGWVGWK